MVYSHIHIITRMDDKHEYFIETLIKQIQAYGERHNVPVSTSVANSTMSVIDPILFISIGGDGTLLHTARCAIEYPNSSVIGINVGTLGFLVEDYQLDDTKLDLFLQRIQDGNAQLDERLMLTTEREEGRYHYNALNEIFITNSSNSFAIFDYMVFINDKFVTEQRGSGILVSTSTGSTAMALSSGGAIISPNTNVLQIVPVAPHSLSARPIITTNRDTIKIGLKSPQRVDEYNILQDGQLAYTLKDDKSYAPSIEIKAHEQKVKLWRMPDWNFFDVLSTKMDWS